MNTKSSFSSDIYNRFLQDKEKAECRVEAKKQAAKITATSSKALKRLGDKLGKDLSEESIPGISRVFAMLMIHAVEHVGVMPQHKEALQEVKLEMMCSFGDKELKIIETALFDTLLSPETHTEPSTSCETCQG